MSKRPAKASGTLAVPVKQQLIGFIFGILGTLVTLFLTGVLTPWIAEKVGEKQIRGIDELISAEARLATLYSRGDKAIEASYGNLFTSDAWVLDAQDPQTGAVGRKAIIERLRTLPPLDADHRLTVRPTVLTEFLAIAQTRTALRLKGKIMATGHERWFFRKIDGSWKIQRFEYNLSQSER